MKKKASPLNAVLLTQSGLSKRYFQFLPWLPFFFVCFTLWSNGEVAPQLQFFFPNSKLSISMINFPELTLPICSYARIGLHEKKKK